MKKLVSLALVLVLVLGVAGAAQAVNLSSPSEYIFMVVNDRPVTFGVHKAFTLGGYTYVPDYFLKEWFDCVLGWDDATKTLFVEKDGATQTVCYSAQTVNLNGTGKSIASYYNNAVLMVPVEPILESFGYVVHYNPDGPILRITNGWETLTDQEIHDQFIAAALAEKAKVLPPKPVFLTFDDGPDRSHTPMILDLLKKYNAKATFFMLDNQMKQNPDIVRRVLEEGHAIGLHGVTHDYTKVYRDSWSVTREMVAENETLYGITGYKSSLVRVPYGSVPKMTAAQYQNLTNSGYLMWDWNIDTGDALKANVPADKIYQEAVGPVKNFARPVILFHDRTNSVYALERVLQYLTNNGYTPVAINDQITPYNWKNR